jgi:drug/metabolite transporter (DMT)-like permease
MQLRDAMILVTLGLLWGASFLFIRVAVPEFGTFALIGLRVVLAAVVLLPLVLIRRQLREVLTHWRSIALIGVLHYAIPFCLYAYAMLTLSAGYSSLVNAAAPLFAGLVARLWLGERLDASRAAGLVLGLAGVALLVGDKLTMAGDQDAIAVSATLLAAFCYGFAAVMAKRRLAGVSPTAVAGGSMSAAAIALLPLSVWLWPDLPPSANAWGMAALLGVICTAVAFVLYFRLIASVGPSKSITVTFLIPLFAVAFGALFLGEKVTASMIAGGAVIIIGTALATGLVSLGVLLRKSRVFASRTAVVVLAVAALGNTPPDVHAAEVDTSVYLAVNSFSYRGDDGWNSFPTLALSGELERVFASQSMVASLFAEYHASNDASVDGTIFAGMLVGHRGRRWDSTAYLFTSRFPGTASRTTFKVRVRRGLGDGARVGIEYIADTGSPESGELKFGYYRSIGSTMSLKFLAGAVLIDNSQPLAQLELAWRLR